jgi:hypothetical protein
VLKKSFVIAAVLFLILLAMFGYNQYSLNQYGTSPFGEVFGYIYYVVIAAGIIGVIWLLLKPAKKKD